MGPAQGGRASSPRSGGGRARGGWLHLHTCYQPIITCHGRHARHCRRCVATAARL